jgi:hypothetical protein
MPDPRSPNLDAAVEAAVGAWRNAQPVVDPWKAMRAAIEAAAPYLPDYAQGREDGRREAIKEVAAWLRENPDWRWPLADVADWIEKREAVADWIEKREAERRFSEEQR